jgi:hypothetical protein
LRDRASNNSEIIVDIIALIYAVCQAVLKAFGDPSGEEIPVLNADMYFLACSI